MTNKPQALDEQMIEEMAKAICLANDDDLVRENGFPEWRRYLVDARAAHSLMAAKVAELEELVDDLVERGLGCGAFDDDLDPLWSQAAAATGRDPDTGNRAALAPHPEGTDQ